MPFSGTEGGYLRAWCPFWQVLGTGQCCGAPGRLRPRPFLQIHPEDGFDAALGRVGEVVDSADADVGVIGHPEEV